MWKDIVGYENMYQVSDSGEIKSVERHIKNGSQNGMILKERILKKEISKNGYEQVSLMNNNSRKVKYVHRLVAEAFLFPSEGKSIINHIDGNKTNNNITNLEYVSYAENNKHAYDTGLHGQGENHYKSKLTLSDVKEIKNKGKYDTYENIGNKYNVSRATIRDILVGKTWKTA